jgi:hypothetical protein
LGSAGAARGVGNPVHSGDGGLATDAEANSRLLISEITDMFYSREVLGTEEGHVDFH